MKILPKSVLGAVLLLAPFALHAQESLTAFTFTIENDSVPHLGNNQDRNYTGGFGFQFSGDFVRQYHLSQPLEWLDAHVPPRVSPDVFDRESYSLSLLGSGFTPDTLNTAAPIPNDRPYASLTALAVRRVRVNSATFKEAWTSELVVGALGLNFARDIQTRIHHEIRRGNDVTPYDPLGWANQVSDGGEPTALYRTMYEKLLAGDSGTGVRKHRQLTGGFETNLGYYTNAAAFTGLRIGAFNSEFWEFAPNGLGPVRQAASAETLPNWEVFGFLSARARLVIYNALLEGQFRESVVTATPQRLLAEWNGGIAVRYRRFALIYDAFAGRSPEFKGAAQQRTHTWGSVALVFGR